MIKFNFEGSNINPDDLETRAFLKHVERRLEGLHDQVNAAQEGRITPISHDGKTMCKVEGFPEELTMVIKQRIS